jgi:glycosyltransferase involved in cell wall biosynthesis
MRILIVHNTLNDSRSVNGVMRHFTCMANEWAAQGHPTDFMVARAGFPQFSELSPRAELVSSDNIFDATRHLAKTWTYFPAYGWRMLNAHWTRLPHRYDVIVSSAQAIFELYPSMVLARRQKAKLAVKIHHVLGAQPERRGLFDRLFLITERMSVRWINRHADLLICSTGIVAADYRAIERNLGLKPRSSVEIAYGIDTETIRPDPSASKLYDAVFLARLHEHKGVFDLAPIWKGVVASRPDARLLVIGEGPRRLEIESIFREMGMGDNVVFAGGVPERKKNELLRQSRIGISLSFEEGWGLSVTEYLASGLPVVAYALPVYELAFPQQTGFGETRRSSHIRKAHRTPAGRR